MDKIKQTAFYIVGGFIAAWPLIFRILYKAVQYLGDADTMCSVASMSSPTCGSTAMITFLYNPPAWLVSLTVLFGVTIILWGERRRYDTRLPTREQATAATKKAWEFHAEFRPLKDEVKILDKKIDALVDQFNLAFSALDMIKKSNTTAERTCLDIDMKLQNRLNLIEQTLQMENTVKDQLLGQMENQINELNIRLDALNTDST